MADQCTNCGAELFAGQQFCRACGTPTRHFSSEDLPTQILPDQQQQQQQVNAEPFGTVPLAGRDTSDPVYPANFSQYQPPVAAQTTSLPVAPPPLHRRRRRGWLYAVIAIFVLCVGAAAVAGLFFLSQPRQVARKIVRTERAPIIPHPPGRPPELDGMLIDEEEEGAEVNGGQTIITKTYALAKEGTFAIHNLSGDITIEGWDEPQAEVKIIKRAGLKIMREQSANRLVFNTMPESRGGVSVGGGSGSGGGAREVRYEVKLPRGVRELEIISNNSGVSLTNVEAKSISIIVQRGDIELEDVGGTVNSRTTKGHTKVVLSETARSAPQVFNGISGDIELQLNPEMNAELKAETIDGDIEIADEFGIKVERRMVGRQAVGRIGKGGQPIVVKTVSGNIKIRS
ncbi:MAG: DUF4097 family beta strand repeat-containing protein [Pyrinomonadaceae bacterium]